MEVEDICCLPGDYWRQGIILDLHLSQKLNWDDAVSWALELHAWGVLELLNTTYLSYGKSAVLARPAAPPPGVTEEGGLPLSRTNGDTI